MALADLRLSTEPLQTGGTGRLRQLSAPTQPVRRPTKSHVFAGLRTGCVGGDLRVETDEHAAELAHHFAQAETVTGTEKLVRYCLLAGEQAKSSVGPRCLSETEWHLLF